MNESVDERMSEWVSGVVSEADMVKHTRNEILSILMLIVIDIMQEMCHDKEIKSKP